AAYAAGAGAAIVGGGSSRCDAAKLRCLGRYLAGMTGCHGRAAMTMGIADPACLARWTGRLSGAPEACLEKAEGPENDCTVTGDAAALSADAAAFVHATLCALDP